MWAFDDFSGYSTAVDKNYGVPDAANGFGPC